ncbi:MAG: hypothetical protein MRY83_12430 [Flavobacteriales bacterium]|nr:hypothetical protein [Flavobacteriales bacterium]
MLRRFTIYAVSVIWGMFIVYFLLLKDKDRNLLGWLPSNRVKTKLLEGEIEFSKQAKCQFLCAEMPIDSIKTLIPKGEVEFDKSKVRKVPKQYVLSFESGSLQELVLSQFDDFAVLDRVSLSSNLNCECE